MTTTSVGQPTFVLSTCLAFKSAEGSYGPTSSTDDSGVYPLDQLVEFLKGRIEVGYVLDLNQNPNPTNTNLFLVDDVPASDKQVGWKVWCQITQASGLQQILNQALNVFDEATQARFRGQPI